MTRLETEGLSAGYKGKALISEVNLMLEPGLATALIGRNGAGKTTLLKTLTGNLKPIEGKVTVDGREIRELAKRERARLMAVVGTEKGSAGGLRLKEAVAIGRTPYTGRLGTLSRRDLEITEEAMEKTGIIHKRESFIAELSDGERQKGMIARGLAQETPILILDEPFAFLDAASRIETADLLNRLAREEGKAILYSTHEVGEALRTAGRIWMITEGKAYEGKPADLIEAGLADRLFEGTNVRFDRKTYNYIMKQ